MNDCPCCSSKLLCHINQQKIYWFCSNCGQEMPNLNDLNKTKTKAGRTNFSVISTQNQPITM
jgi:DNA-directed RNA polymerase subunit M/transcription elongation factor TFIIS